jgi:hypothetical protein
MAGLLKAMGRYAEAETFYQKAITIRERLAADNPDVFGADLEQSRQALRGMQCKPEGGGESRCMGHD